MQLVQGMSIKDCQEGGQRATEVDNDDASMNHMPDLWKSDVLDADISRRTKKLTEKGMQYRLGPLRERRSKHHGKLLRKSSMIDEMTYSWVNAAAIRKEINQFNDIIKLFMLTHEEYQNLQTNEEQAVDLCELSLSIVNGMTNLMRRCLVLNIKRSSG